MKRIILSLIILLISIVGIAQVPSIGGILPNTNVPSIFISSSAQLEDFLYCQSNVTGYIYSDGGSAILESGICQSVNHNPTISDTKYPQTFTTNPFSWYTYPSLVPVYVRAFARNANGTSYSNEIYVTPNTAPTAYISVDVTSSTTASITIGSSSIYSLAGVTLNCSNGTDNRALAYDTYSNPYTWDLTGLTAGSIYHVYGNFNGCIIYFPATSFLMTVSTYLPDVITNFATSITTNSASVSGNVTSQGSSSVTARGICYAVTSSPDITDNIVSGGSGLGEFTCSLSTLDPNTLYYYRAYATNAYGTSYGSEYSFRTTALYLPTVITSNVTNITNNMATSGGNVTSDGNSTVTARGVCWSTSINPTTSNSKTIDGSGTGSFVSTLSSLSSNTTYYVRAYATNTNGTAYGNNMAFTTNSDPAIALSIIGSTTTSINVSYYGTSCPNIINEMGAVLSSSTRTPTIVNTKISNFPSNVCYYGNQNLFNNLSNSTKYYIRSFLITTYGILYSAVDSIVTGASITIPTVSTAAVSGITYGFGATSGGDVTSSGGATVTARGVCWSTSLNPTISNNKTINGNGIGSFTSNLSNLNANTIYHVRAYATNGAGTTYGADIQFKTWSTYSPNNISKSLTYPYTSDTEYVTLEGSAPSVSIGYSVLEEWKTLSILDFYPDLDSDGNDFYTLTYNGIEVTTFPLNIDLQSLNAGNHTGLAINYSDIGEKIFNNAVSQNCGIKYNITNMSNAIGYTHTLTESLFSYPIITTVAASSITSSTAISGGDISTSSYVSERGVCWSYVTTTPTTTNNNGKTINGTGIGSYSSYLSGLSTGVTYYIRAYAIIAEATVYGNAVSFVPTSASVLPVVQNLGVTNITSSGVTFNGEVLSEGSATVTSRGVCYSTSHDPVYTGSGITSGSGLGVYSGSVNTLDSGTLYYYRAFAVSSVGVAYSVEYSFATNDIPDVVPTIVLYGDYDTSPSGSVLISGNVTSDGGSSVIERGVCWNTVGSPIITDSHTVASTSGTGIYSVSATNLIAGVTYSFRLYALNDVGVGYSTEYVFTTLSDLPIVVLNSITTVTGNSGIGNATVTSNGSGTVSQRGICWSTNQNPTTAADIRYGVGGLGDYSFTMDGLYENTTYYVRAFATSEFGVSYSNQLSFVPTTPLLDCNADQSFSGGFSSAPRIYNINFGNDAGLYILGFQNRVIPDKIEVYQGTNIKATTVSEVTGGSVGVYPPLQAFHPDRYPLRFIYDPANGTSGQIKVYTSNEETKWYFTQACPAVSLLDTEYTLNNKNYSFYYTGLTSNTDYNLQISATSGTSQIEYIVWDALNSMPPFLPKASGTTSSLPASIIFNTGSSSVIVIDVKMVSNSTNYKVMLSVN